MTKLQPAIFATLGEQPAQLAWRACCEFHTSGPAFGKVMSTLKPGHADEDDVGNLPAISSGPDWWDYFIGVKTHNAITEKWDFDFYGTVGTGGSDLPLTLQGMFGRRYSNGNRLGLGVRVWGIDYSDGEGLMNKYTALDATFYGLMIGYEFN